MAIKIKTDKLKQDIVRLVENVELAAAESERIKADWQMSPEYKEDQLKKTEEKYKAAIKELTEGMKKQVETDVSAAAVTRSVDYAAETYHAMTVKQEIDGLATAELSARYADIVAEGDASRKKHFERLAVAAMKNNGDETEALIFKQKVYSNMNEVEKDDVDTRNAAPHFLYNVGIIENQVNTFLNDALEGRDTDLSALTDIWEEGSTNAERNAMTGLKIG